MKAKRPVPNLIYDPPDDPLRVLYVDEDLLVLSKPSGLLSVPGRGEHLSDCMSTRAQKEYPDALVVHRLDMETSGVFLMARNKAAQGHIGKQFEARTTNKYYITRVWGHVEEESGVIDLPMRCDWDNRPRQMVCFEHGKNAVTEWKVLEREPNAITRLRLKPITGRSHQLRVHMEEIGYPMLGEVFYAHDAARDAAPRLQLHAEMLEIEHPTTGERIIFTDPAPF
ncbi:MAG: pseudouridine synthase [Alphaproteobacteria bacterium]